jgi:Ca2+-binding RTX toxin-like protein
MPHMTPLEPRTLLSVDYTATVTVTPGVYMPGEVVPITVHLKNGGTSSSIFPSTHAVVLSRDGQYGNGDDIPMGNFNTQGLGAGQVINQAVTGAIGNAPAGNYFVVVKVDTVNTVNESNEANAFFTATPVITIPSNDLPSGPITGTAGNDVILLQQKRGKLVVTVNGVARAGAIPASLFVDAGFGHDKVVADATVTARLAITGNACNDTLVGGNGNDEISGALGYDRVHGGAGNDFLLGGAVNDYLSGEAGNDLLIGGGGNDRLADVVGKDRFIGSLGNDVNVSRDLASDATNDPDTVSGGFGADRAQLDAGGTFPDTHSSIEEMLA